MSYATLLPRLTGLLVVAAILTVLLLALALMIWVQPTGDDFCRASVTDWVEGVVINYRSWSGRWAAIAIHTTVLPSIDLTSHYPFAIIFLSFLLAISCLAFAELLFQNEAPAYLVLAVGAALLAMYWVGIPGPKESVYWFTGHVENLLPVSVGIGAIWFLWRSGKEGTSPVASKAFIISALLLCVLVTGLHEIAAMAMTVVVGAGALATRVLGNKGYRPWTLALMIVLIGSAVSIFAPGNGARAESGFFSGGFSLAGFLWGFRNFAQEVLIPWTLDPRLLLGSLLFVIHPGFRAIRPAWVTGENLVFWRWLIPVAWLLSFGGVAFSVILATGSAGPARTQGFLYGIFLLGWFATLFAWSRPRSPELSASEDSWTMSKALLVAVANLLFAKSLLSAPNVTAALNDFRGQSNPARWREAMMNHYELTEAAASSGAHEVVLPRPPPVPASYPWCDIGSDDYDGWCRKCYARYFGLESVKLASP